MREIFNSDGKSFFPESPLHSLSRIERRDNPALPVDEFIDTARTNIGLMRAVDSQMVKLGIIPLDGLFAKIAFHQCSEAA